MLRHYSMGELARGLLILQLAVQVYRAKVLMPHAKRQMPPERSPQRVRQQRGTTIMELMVGLAILAILTGLSIPGIASLVRQYDLRSAADDVVYGAELARSLAASNRRAYGLLITPLTNASPLKFSVVQGTGTSCSTLAGGTTVYSADYSPGNLTNEPPIRVRAFAPSELNAAGANICFKNDGRVLRADLGIPFSPPLSTQLSAGDVFLELVRITETGAEIGTPLQVQIGYNGTARILSGRMLNNFQGSGDGGTP